MSSTVVHIQNGAVLHSSSSSYSSLNIIGEGYFGKVARGQNLETKEEAALKIPKPEWMQDIKKVHFWLQTGSFTIYYILLLRVNVLR